MKSKQILLVFFAALQIVFAQARVDVQLNFADGSGDTRNRNLGLDSLATTGVDTNLGEEALPPLPPGFEVRFDLNPFGVSQQVYKDYRNAPSFPFTGTIEHRLNWQYSASATGFTVEYNLPAGVQMRIQDAFTSNGLLFNSGDLSGEGSYSIPNAVSASFTSAKLFMVYLGVIPVELKSFNASINGNQIIFKWQTATEMNNKGFDIECRIDSESWEKIGFIEGHGTSTRPSEYKFMSTLTKSGKLYSFRLKQLDYDGSYNYSFEIYLNASAPNVFVLNQNFPNPFNPATTISFSIPEKGNVKLTVFNQIGQLVDELVNGSLEPGIYSYTWNAKNMSSGIYYYKIQSENFKSIKKMTLIK